MRCARMLICQHARVRVQRLVERRGLERFERRQRRILHHVLDVYVGVYVPHDGLEITRAHVRCEHHA